MIIHNAYVLYKKIYSISNKVFRNLTLRQEIIKLLAKCVHKPDIAYVASRVR